jgi:hypothetical protein
VGAAGLGTYLSGYTDYQHQRDACGLTPCRGPDHDRAIDQIKLKRAVGSALLGVAAAIAISDLALWVADALRARHRSIRQSWRGHPGGFRW